MAIDMNQELLNKVIYEVYIRNHSQEGNFKGLQKDLPRIKSLGVDIVWLMPIHPIGRLQRKNSLGCPYSIQDYRKINPEYGTLEDLKNLIAVVHDQGMQIIIDIVYNHTSHDSWLLKNHPEWFLREPSGEIGRKVADWTDVLDLDYNHPELWKYQIDTLKFWIDQGVDGFRCDVASLVPVQFWAWARQELQKNKPDVIWLAESSDPSHISAMRRQGFSSHSDSELYQAFDITYDYDVYHTFQAYLRGENTLEQYLSLLRQQEVIYPANYVKLRFLENHDQPRIRSMILFAKSLEQWTAFLYFQKGTTLIYAGQETPDLSTPSLFERDLVEWSSLDPCFSDLLKTLSVIKKEPIVSRGFYQIQNIPNSGVIWASYRLKGEELHGVFNVEGKYGSLKIDCPDGAYTNLVDSQEVIIEDGMIKLQSNPVIIRI